MKKHSAGVLWTAVGDFIFVNFFVMKGPAADATDALQPWGLLRQLCDEDD
jgi:hypothetical protein